MSVSVRVVAARGNPRDTEGAVTGQREASEHRVREDGCGHV
jgi:hypothetical protein